MVDHPMLARLVAQAVAAVHHAADDEFLLRCILVAGHDAEDVHRALCSHRAAPVAVETTRGPPTDSQIIRELEPSRIAATTRYLDTGNTAGADPVDRIIDAVLLLAASDQPGA